MRTHAIGQVTYRATAAYGTRYRTRIWRVTAAARIGAMPTAGWIIRDPATRRRRYIAILAPGAGSALYGGTDAGTRLPGSPRTVAGALRLAAAGFHRWALADQAERDAAPEAAR